MVVGLLFITVGYVIMRLDNQVESFISLYLAPLMILGGYLEIVYAILWKPRSAEADSAQS